MEKEILFHKLVEVQNYFKQEKEKHYLVACKEEHLQCFAESLVNKSSIVELNAPYFEEEIAIDRRTSVDLFSFLNEEMELLKTVKHFEKTMINDFLIVLGQRLTSATIRTEEGLPPLDHEVFKASFNSYNTQISKAVRAFEKHSERTKNSFWRVIKGNPSEKEEKVKELLWYILQHKTWWNVFYHYKHELIYEVRISSGHGARWKKNNLEFIGFVEPFLNSKT